MSSGALNSEKRQAGSSAFGVATLLVLLMLPVLYVLSIGPAEMLWQRMQLNDERGLGNALQTFYWPLLWSIQHSQTFASFIEWYVSFWTQR